MGKNLAFNINSFERSIFSFTGKDKKLLLVHMPSKQVFNRMTGLSELSDNMSYDDLNGALDGLISEILSNNKQGKEVTAAAVGSAYDLEEKLEIFNQYMDFVKGLGNDPN